MSFDRKAYMREYRIKYRKRAAELARKYYAANPEHFRQQAKKYRESHKKEVADYNHSYWLKTRDDKNFQEKRRQWAKNYRTAHQKEHLINSKEQRIIHRDEVKVRSITNHAIRDGKITKQPCENCGAEPAQAHHDDYNKPLAVRWLCQTCHTKWHRDNKPIRKKGTYENTERETACCS